MNDSYSEKLYPVAGTHSTILGVHEISAETDQHMEDASKRPRLNEYNFL